ncbi:hypothetical protein BSR55_02605 [Acinetobacter bereziniae]|nr:hypothetical protein BSR55_02605 [Acinetobacter bereziniae]
MQVDRYDGGEKLPSYLNHLVGVYCSFIQVKIDRMFPIHFPPKIFKVILCVEMPIASWKIQFLNTGLVISIMPQAFGIFVDY